MLRSSCVGAGGLIYLPEIRCRHIFRIGLPNSNSSFLFIIQQYTIIFYRTTHKTVAPWKDMLLKIK